MNTRMNCEERDTEGGEMRQKDRGMDRNLPQLLGDHIPEFIAVLLRSWKKQRLSVISFQSPFEHFNAPGIQSKDAIMCLTTSPTSSLFSTTTTPQPVISLL